MKKSFTKFLSTPKMIIPVFTVIVFALTAFAYGRIGQAPAIPSSIEVSAPGPVIAAGSNVSLSFSKSGRVETVAVKNGDEVKAGEVLATLYAPDALGAVNQAKGALDLAEAQYASLKVEYDNAKKQQDTMVENARKTLLSAGLEGTPSIQDLNVPVISGTYTCETEGSYILKPYSSGDSDSGFSMNYEGLESGNTGVKFDSPVPLGTCGLQVKFTHVDNFNPRTVWTIDIPNTKSSVYLANKNAYDLAVSNREKVLADLAASINESGNGDSSVAKAQVDAAQGAYQAAQGAYQNNLIISPVSGTVTFIDSDLKVGQSVVSGKPVISISIK